MAGRSVRWTLAEGKIAAAVIPTRPVPAPSSRIRRGSVGTAEDLEGLPSSERGLNSGR